MDSYRECILYPEVPKKRTNQTVWNLNMVKYFLHYDQNSMLVVPIKDDQLARTHLKGYTQDAGGFHKRWLWHILKERLNFKKLPCVIWILQLTHVKLFLVAKKPFVYWRKVLCLMA